MEREQSNPSTTGSLIRAVHRTSAYDRAVVCKEDRLEVHFSFQAHGIERHRQPRQQPCPFPQTENYRMRSGTTDLARPDSANTCAQMTRSQRLPTASLIHLIR